MHSTLEVSGLTFSSYCPSWLGGFWVGSSWRIPLSWLKSPQLSSSSSLQLHCCQQMAPPPGRGGSPRQSQSSHWSGGHNRFDHSQNLYFPFFGAPICMSSWLKKFRRGGWVFQTIHSLLITAKPCSASTLRSLYYIKQLRLKDTLHWTPLFSKEKFHTHEYDIVE